MKTQFYHIMITLFLLAMVHCKNIPKGESVSVDFDARIPKYENNEDGNPSPVILRVSLKDSKVDLMKYALPSLKEQLHRQEYYTMYFSNDIYLISGTDTFPCIDSHMEQLYMDVPYRTFILNFGENGVKAKDEIIIIDKVFSNKVVVVSINNKSLSK